MIKTYKIKIKKKKNEGKEDKEDKEEEGEEEIEEKINTRVTLNRLEFPELDEFSVLCVWLSLH